MNYQRIYDEFIADRRLFENKITSGFDSHHVIPKCLGGGNAKENLVKLSYPDHLFAHVLLAKIHGGYLRVAVVMMFGRERYIGRKSRDRYKNLRNEWRAAASEKFTRLWAEDAEFRDRQAKRLGARWKDETFRAVQLEKNRLRWEDQEQKRMQSERSFALWADPEFRSSMGILRKTWWQNPENRQWQVDRMTALWANPAYRERVLASRTPARKLSLDECIAISKRMMGKKMALGYKWPADTLAKRVAVMMERMTLAHREDRRQRALGNTYGLGRRDTAEQIAAKKESARAAWPMRRARVQLVQAFTLMTLEALEN